MPTNPRSATGFFAGLDPIDRLSESIFGIIITLTFTSAMSVASGSAKPVLVAALSCNIAWGLVDSLMYCLTTLVENGRREFHFKTLAAEPPPKAHAMLQAWANEHLGLGLSNAQADAAIAWLKAGRAPARPLTVTDLKAALGVFVVAASAGLPISIPFLFTNDLAIAIRASNAVGVLLLFVAGYALDRQMGRSGWRLGLGCALFGSLLTGITIRLGG